VSRSTRKLTWRRKRNVSTSWGWARVVRAEGRLRASTQQLVRSGSATASARKCRHRPSTYLQARRRSQPATHGSKAPQGARRMHRVLEREIRWGKRKTGGDERPLLRYGWPTPIREHICSGGRGPAAHDHYFLRYYEIVVSAARRTAPAHRTHNTQSQHTGRHTGRHTVRSGRYQLSETVGNGSGTLELTIRYFVSPTTTFLFFRSSFKFFLQMFLYLFLIIRDDSFLLFSFFGIHSFFKRLQLK
jgi:hypothetical protein